MTNEWVVVVDCGWSDWFEVRDIRVYGRFENADKAKVWANTQAETVTGREGQPITCTVMLIGDTEGGVVV